MSKNVRSTLEPPPSITGMGIVPSVFNEGFPPKSRFSRSDIPDLTGRVFIITGGAAGLGRETAKALLTKNAKVYIATRNQTKSEKVIDELLAETGNQAYFLKLDLADLDSIKAAAAEFLQKETQLHVLYNNAGVMLAPIDQLTAQGYDLQFGTNVLGHFYLTKLLLPTLLDTARNAGFPSRVVTLASSTHLFINGIDFAAFKDSPRRRQTSTERLYSQSKYGDIIFAKELARRYGDQGIVSISLNPGNIKTDLQRHFTSIQTFFINLILWDLHPNGALTQLYAGTSPEADNLNGKYLIPWARVGNPLKGTQDPEIGQELWAWLEEQVEGR